MRIGYGYCVGRVKERDDLFLVLAGEELPWHVGVQEEGGCRRDVLSLAVCDALLGAMALGSAECCLEEGFDPRATPGLELLRRAVELLRRRGWKLSNLDIHLQLQDPKFTAHTALLRESLCKALGCTAGRVNLKIGHERCTGPVGKGECINATALCLIEN